MGADLLAIMPAFVREHAAALIVVVPLLAATITTVLPSARGAWAITLATVTVSFVMALVLAAQVNAQGVVSYAMGGFAPPLGIEYRIDSFNIILALLVTSLGVLCVFYAPSSIASEIVVRKQPLFYSAFLICFAGLIGVATTGDAFNLFVFLEISSLSTYVLVAMGAQRDRRALTAAYNYLILGTIGATFFVIGVGFLYAATGTLNLVDMAERLGPLSDNTAVRTGFAFIVIGLGLKIAMYPLHTWLPNAYAYAPTFVTVFLAATATKVAFYALLRFVYSVFGPAFAFQELTLVWLFAPLGIAGMLVGSFQAVFQHDTRRLFAYSSVAQIGYMLLGISFGTAAGLGAGLLHLINHAVIKGALFMALGAACLRFGVVHVRDFRGLGRTMPFTMAAFTVAALSLVGVPLTAGFISKWYLLTAALDRGWWFAVAAVAVSSILAFIYVGRILEMAYLRDPPMRDGVPAARHIAPASMLIALWFLALANIWFGVNAELTSDLAFRAAAFLTGEPWGAGP